MLRQAQLSERSIREEGTTDPDTGCDCEGRTPVRSGVRDENAGQARFENRIRAGRNNPRRGRTKEKRASVSEARSGHWTPGPLFRGHLSPWSDVASFPSRLIPTAIVDGNQLVPFSPSVSATASRRPTMRTLSVSPLPTASGTGTQGIPQIVASTSLRVPLEKPSHT